MLKKTLVHYCSYNQWANQRISGFILEAGEKAADLELESSFRSIRKTLYHIWDAETVWIKRFLSEAVTGWPSRDFKGSLSEACQKFVQTSHDFRVLAEEENENELGRKISYKNIEGKNFTSPAWQIFLHCMNHSTYHRGQIVTLLRQAGFTKLLPLDFIAYCREQPSES